MNEMSDRVQSNEFGRGEIDEITIVRVGDAHARPGQRDAAKSDATAETSGSFH